MSFVSIISLSIAMFVLAASPGPGVFATVARSLASGFRPALDVILGIVVGDIIFLMFAIFGLSIVAQALGELFIIIKICGGIYLCLLGLKIWFSEPSKTESEQLPEKHTRFGNIISGFLVTLSNPKAILFYCSFLPTFINLYILTVVDIVVIVIVVTIVLITVLITYAYLASYIRPLFSSRKVMKRLNRSAGGVMVATGVAIAIKS